MFYFISFFYAFEALQKILIFVFDYLQMHLLKCIYLDIYLHFLKSYYFRRYYVDIFTLQEFLLTDDSYVGPSSNINMFKKTYVNLD